MQHLKSLSVPQAVSQVEPQRAVPAMLQSVYENLTQLEQNIELLRGRLQPVLEIQPDCGDSAEGSCGSYARNVPHAEQLEGIANRIDYLNGRTLDAISRLHV